MSVQGFTPSNSYFSLDLSGGLIDKAYMIICGAMLLALLKMKAKRCAAKPVTAGWLKNK